MVIAAERVIGVRSKPSRHDGRRIRSLSVIAMNISFATTRGQILMAVDTEGANIGPQPVFPAQVRHEETSVSLNFETTIEWGWTRRDCEQFIYDILGVWWPKSACVQCLIWNLGDLGLSPMTLIIWDKFPLVAGHEHARRWLQFTANIGRAPNTVMAYGRAVEDHLRFCVLAGADPLTLRADVVAAWIGDLHERPNRMGAHGAGGRPGRSPGREPAAAVRRRPGHVPGGRRSRSPHMPGPTGKSPARRRPSR